MSAANKKQLDKAVLELTVRLDCWLTVHTIGCLPCHTLCVAIFRNCDYPQPSVIHCFPTPFLLWVKVGCVMEIWPSQISSKQLHCAVCVKQFSHCFTILCSNKNIFETIRKGIEKRNGKEMFWFMFILLGRKVQILGYGFQSTKNYNWYFNISK